jgi:D-alanyl-lipoteichoic acid acyltransferase DltB (MBOAT superfamily)
MIFSLELTLFAYLLIGCVYWLVRAWHRTASQVFLCTANLSLLCLASPRLLGFLIVQLCLVLLLYGLQAVPRPASVEMGWTSWFAFLGLLPINLAFVWADSSQPAWLLGPMGSLEFRNVFWFTGASFVVIKSFILLKEWTKQQRIELLPALCALTFVPSFPAGPIHGSGPWMEARKQHRITDLDLRLIFLKLGWGIGALYVIAPWLLRMANSVEKTIWVGAVLASYLRFAALFYDFSGYTLMAISLAAMMGVTLPENFNRPYLATSIQDFWQRWHLTLSSFISTYLYKPFVRQTGKARLGILIAFLFAGLWHKFSPGFLLWGLGHGGALALAYRPPTWWNACLSCLPVPLAVVLRWLLTFTLVATLSSLATKWLA